jgi:hypothetical protein
MNEPTEDLGELRRRLAQAEADRDVLAAEVRAWREAKYQCEATWDAEERTDASGALQRARSMEEQK